MQVQSHQSKKYRDVEKKLRKRERRLLERLQEAQQAQSNALERFRRVEARLLKRIVRVQCLEECLATIRQQLEALAAAQPQRISTRSSTELSANDTSESVHEEQPAIQAAQSEADAGAAGDATVQPALPEQEATSSPNGTPSQLDYTYIAEIDEEEEIVEATAAISIANVAAAAAAEAEALAESSSVRTREARIAAQQADQVLSQVRTDIQNGVLTDEQAETALLDAERAATHAHAVLSDAEAAEERAVRAAMDAEAEAEVAEGMAFAVEDRSEQDEIARAESNGYNRQEALSEQNASAREREEDEDARKRENAGDEDRHIEDDEDTDEMPVVHPQEQP